MKYLCSIVDKVAAAATTVLLPPFIKEGNDEFQFEVSEKRCHFSFPAKS